MTEPVDRAVYEAEVANGQRALGRWLVEFSQLIWVMRMQLRSAMAVRNGGDVHVIDLLTGAMEAHSLKNAFFASIRYLADPPHDEDEKKVSVTLEDQVSDVIQFRNDLAHGEWFVGWGSTDAAFPDPPKLRRTKPGTRRGPAMTSVTLTVDEMDRRSEALIVLRRMVYEYAALAAGQYPSLTQELDLRVRDVFVTRGKDVYREGPGVASGRAGTGPVF